jgi:hypothetical protein
MANLLDVQATLPKANLKDSYFPDYEPFAVKKGQKMKFDDDKNELIVKLPTGKTRRVKMTKRYLESFTEYL